MFNGFFLSKEELFSLSPVFFIPGPFPSCPRGPERPRAFTFITLFENDVIFFSSPLDYWSRIFFSILVLHFSNPLARTLREPLKLNCFSFPILSSSHAYYLFSSFSPLPRSPGIAANAHLAVQATECLSVETENHLIRC